MDYVTPLNGDQNDDNRPYIDENAGIGIEGSIPRAAAFEHPLREIINVISEANLVPDSDDLTQLHQAIMVLISDNIPENNQVLSTRQYFSASGTFVVPPDVTKIRAWLSGGGGGGGLANGSVDTDGFGGDGGTSTFGTLVSNGGDGGNPMNEASPIVTSDRNHGEATGGDINITGGGAVGGPAGFYPAAASANQAGAGANGGLAICDITVVPGASIPVVIGAGGSGSSDLSGSSGPGVNGEDGYLILEW